MDAGMATMSVVVFGVLFLSLGAGIWVGFSLFIVGFVGMSLFSSLPAGNNMASAVWATIEKWEYVALPMFILMGEILYRSGISERLFRALVPWLCRLPVGLLLMNIISCTLFAAVSGSSAANTATAGRITLAELNKLGYERAIAQGSLAGAGTLGFLIPPSLIMMIVVSAGFLSRVMGFLGIPAAITTAITGMDLSPYTLMILLGLVYVALGCLLDGFSIALPIVIAAGFDPIWFGIYLILMVEVSQITPPVGFNLFVIQGLTGDPIMRIARHALPFFFLMLLTTAIITIFPKITLFLPELMTVK